MRRKNVSPLGLADDTQGMEAEWPRLPTAGSVHDSPTRKGASKTSKHFHRHDKLTIGFR